MITRQSMIAKIGADITDFEAKLRLAAQRTDEFRNKTERSGQQAEGRVKSMMGAALSAKAAFAGLAGSAVVAGFNALAEQATALENQMRGIGIATDEARDKIYRLAVETRTPIDATVGLLRSMTKSLRDQPLDQTIRQVATLNRLLTVGGLDAGQRGSVSLQLGQALQSGVLQGDELRALRESAPYELLEAIAEAAGGTVAQLRTLGQTSKLTTETIVRALDNMEQESKEKFASFDMTVRESASVLQTALIQAAGRMDEGLGFTEMLASAQSSLAETLMSSGDAATALGEALADLAKLALIAAGARGLAAVGAAAANATIATVAAAGAVNGLNATLVATVAAQKAFGGIISLLGGPWGAAFFAAGTAAFVLAKNIKSVEEQMEAAQTATERASSAASAYAEARDAIRGDQEALLAAEERLRKAIEDQATAAEATAQRDITAINARIAKNEELLALKQALIEAEQDQARGSIADAEAALASQARGRLGLQQAGELSWLEMFAAGAVGGQQLVSASQLTDEQALAAEVRRIGEKRAANEELLDVELQFLRDYVVLQEGKEQLAAKDREIMEILFPPLDAHIRERERVVERVNATLDALMEKQTKRNNQLRDLEAARSELNRQLIAGGQSGAELQSLNLRIRAVDDEIEKLTDAKGRVEQLRASADSLRQVIAVSSAEDARTMTGMLDIWERKLRDVEAAGDDVNNTDLTELEAGLASLLTLGDQLIAKFREFSSVTKGLGDLGPLPTDQWNAQLNAMNVTGMLEYLKQVEGFRATPYYDANAYRVGYGTDRIYDAQGNPQAVTPATRVTEEQASYALMRRLAEDFIPPIIEAVGRARWDVMTEQQRTALASLSYNYGAGEWRQGGDLQLVVDAVRSGSEQAVANAIASLATQGPFRDDGTPVNRDRRLREAAMWGPQSEESRQVIAAQDEAIAAAEARERWLQTLKDGIEQARLEAEIAGLTYYEQQRILFVEQEKARARSENRELSQEDLRLIEAAADAEIEKLRTIGAIEKQREVEEAEHRERMVRLEEQAGERMQYNASLQDAIVDGSIQTVMNARSWSDALEGAGEVLKNVLGMYVEALLRSAMFGQGPLSGQTSGSGGLFGGLLNLGLSLFGAGGTGGTVGTGGSYAADPLSSALYGTGVFAATDFAPAFSPFSQDIQLPRMGASPFSRSEVDLNVNLNHPMLEMEIRQSARQEVAAAEPKIQVRTQKAMAERMRSSKTGWAI